MGQDTTDDGRLPFAERTHAAHANAAYAIAERVDTLYALAESTSPDTRGRIETASYEREAARLERRAQWLATMAVYEALVLPGYGMSVGEQLEHEREGGAQ